MRHDPAIFKWEYAVLGFTAMNNGSGNLKWNGPDGIREQQHRRLPPREFIEQLNQAGGSGWEAVGYTSTMGGAPVVVVLSCLLRRPLA
jgi:hypothetical protein